MSSNNLFQIAHDDELLDALGARQSDATSRASGGAGDQTHDAFAADLDAWVRSIDADVDAADSWTSALGGASRVTVQEDGSHHAGVAASAGASTSTPLRVSGHGGAYSASRDSMFNRVADARRQHRGGRRHSWKAGAAAVSVGAALSLSGVAAAVSGGKIDNLGPLDLRWTSAVNEPATVADDVPAAKATDSGVPTVAPARPTIEARSGAEGQRPHGAADDLPRRVTTTHDDEGSTSEQTSEWPRITERRPGLVPTASARPTLPSTRRPNGSWSTASRPSATSKPSTGSTSSSKPSRPTKPTGSGSPTSSPTSKPSTPGTRPTSPSATPTSGTTGTTSTGTTSTSTTSGAEATGSSSGQATSSPATSSRATSSRAVPSRAASSRATSGRVGAKPTTTRSPRQGSSTARVGTSRPAPSSSSPTSLAVSSPTSWSSLVPTVTTATSE